MPTIPYIHEVQSDWCSAVNVQPHLPAITLIHYLKNFKINQITSASIKELDPNSASVNHCLQPWLPVYQ